MKKTFLHFLKTALALLLFFGAVGEVSGQTIAATNTSTVGVSKVPPGWTILSQTPDISSSTTNAGISGSFGWANSGTVTNPPNGHTTWPDGYWSETIGTTITGLIAGKTYIFTFYIAEMQSTNGGTIDPTYDGVFEVASYVGSTYTPLATYPFTGGSSTAWSTKTLSFTATATTLPVAFRYQNAAAPQNGNFWNLAVSADAVVLPCNAGTTAPTLSGTTITNTCPTTTVNLNSLLSSSATPAQISMLKWFTDTARTTAVADATAAPAGTYYAFYYDSVGNCYSPASAAVTATTPACCPTVAPTVN